MPKLVFDELVRKIRRDITGNYKVGARYLTLRQICEKFSVSPNTAQKAIHLLTEKNIVRSAPRAGITVTSLEEDRDITGKRIVLLSNADHPALNQAFLDGAIQVADKEGIECSVTVNPQRDEHCHALPFAEYLLGLNADGLISISFTRTFLPFYHAITQGLDIVADRPMPELPILPVLAIDHTGHGKRIGTGCAARGFNEVLAIGGLDLDSDTWGGLVYQRYEGVRAGFEQDERILHYVNFSRPGHNDEVDAFFRDWGPGKAVISLHNGANWYTAYKFVEHGIRVKDHNLVLFSTMEEEYKLKGLPPIRSQTPTARQWGAALAKKLIKKWKTGKFALPLVEMI